LIKNSPFMTGFFQAGVFWIAVTHFTYVIWGTGTYPVLNIFLLFSVPIFIYLLKKIIFSDPGYLPLSTTPSLNKNIFIDLIETNKISNRTFCTSCFIRKPLRSKHVNEYSRCIAVFDHYCPWLNSPIGLGNHRHFVMFLFVLLFAQIGHAYLAYVYVSTRSDLTTPLQNMCYLPWLNCYYINSHPWISLTGTWCLFFSTWTIMTLASQIYQISIGLTTNEYLNWHRYDRYLQEVDPSNPSDKRYTNPFDYGLLKNWVEFWSSSGTNSRINWFELYSTPRKKNQA